MKRSIYITAAFTAGAVLITSQAAYAGEQAAENAGKFAIVTKSMGNPYNMAMADGFQKVIEENGGICIVNHPQYASADAQIPILESLISQEVDVLAVAANEQARLRNVLQDAKRSGIKILTIDADAEHEDRLVFCNQSDAKIIGQTMMDAIYDLTQGEGEFAILSATAVAANQNAWLAEMKAAFETDPKYSNLVMVDTVYGNDDVDMSSQKTKELLQKYPDLKVICAITSAGITAAAKTMSEEKTDVLLTGIGMPSEMSEYTGEEDGMPCPYFYYWDPAELGQLGAYTALALQAGTITGAAGETFEAGELEGSPFTITETTDDENATEILLGSLHCFDGSTD